MARDEKDVSSLRLVRTTLTKRGFDTTRADVRVSHGVCYIKGLVSPMKGVSFSDIRIEMEQVRQILRQKQGIRDVMVDCTYPGNS